MDLISIKQTSASNFYEGLGQLKGVDLTSASIGFKVINTRGFNSTSPVRSLQLIDGVDNNNYVLYGPTGTLNDEWFRFQFPIPKNYKLLRDWTLSKSNIVLHFHDLSIRRK